MQSVLSAREQDLNTICGNEEILENTDEELEDDGGISHGRLRKATGGKTRKGNSNLRSNKGKKRRTVNTSSDYEEEEEEEEYEEDNELVEEEWRPDTVSEEEVILEEEEEETDQVEGKEKVVTFKDKKPLGQKILVFAHHHNVLDGIENMLRDAEVSFIRVDGKTTKARKNMLIHQFQTSPEVRNIML